MSEELNLRQAAERLLELGSKIDRATTEDEENRLCDERDKLLSMMRKADALLSSPRAEDVRREALEEAAKVADHVYGKNVLTGPYAHMDDTPELESARDAATEIAKAIRALSPPVKDKP